MKYLFFLILICSSCLFTIPCFSQENLHQHSGLTTRRGSAAASGSWESVSYSMAIWGTGIAIGIGLLCAFLKYSTAAGGHAHTHS